MPFTTTIVFSQNRQCSKAVEEKRLAAIKGTTNRDGQLSASVALMYTLLGMFLVRIPAFGEPFTALLSTLLGGKTQEYPMEVLSPITWVAHFALALLGRQIVLAMRKPSNEACIRAFGLTFLMAETSAVLFLLHHSLLSCDEPYAQELGMNLKIIGDYFSQVQVYSASLALVAPSWGLNLSVPIMLSLAHADVLAFNNAYGGILCAATLVCVLTTKALHPVFKLGYVGLAMVPSFKVDSSSDEGHLTVSCVLAVLAAALLVGLKLKESTTKIPKLN